jgi:hypothetical protein
MVEGKNVSIDSLFQKTNEFVSRFVVHHSHILDYISALILFSYFQDRFSTIPYTMFVSDGGSGKSTIGNVFEDLGYRCVNMTDPTTANIFRIFGTVEVGQCTLVLDEAERVDRDKDMMGILKNGYENGKKITRLDQFERQKHFHAFGLKILSAERTPNPSSASGVLDRTFVISNFKGKPEYDIKEIRIPKSAEQKRVSKYIDFLRKSLFIYRLAHFNNEIKDIETGLDGRDKELCKPILQVFYETKSQQRIERFFEKLLDEKNGRKANSLERDVLEVVVSLFDACPDGIIPFNDIWLHLTNKTGGHLNENKSHILETDAYGSIYKTSLSKALRDKFGARDPKTRDSKTRFLAFDIEKTKDHLRNYTKDNSPTKISCCVKLSDRSDSSDSNREDLFDNFFSIKSTLLINNEENASHNLHENMSKEESTRFNDDKKNYMGLFNSVTAVTPVTFESTKDETGFMLKEKNDSTALSEGMHNSLGNGVKAEIFECYYCHDFSSTTNKKEYESHVVLKHPRKLAYPSKYDLQKKGIESKGKRWEI